MPGRITFADCDVIIGGTLSGEVIVPSDGTVTGDSVSAVDGDQIPASKLRHANCHRYAQDSTTAATVERRVLHRMQGAGTLLGFQVGNVVAATGTGNAVLDLLKNGSSILTGTLTIDSTTTAYTVVVSGTFSSAALVTGDILELKVTSAADGSGAKPKGVWGELFTADVYGF